MSAAHDDTTEIDSVCPHGPEEARPDELRYIEAIDDGQMVGFLYHKDEETEWIQADVDAFVEVENGR